MAPRPIGAGEGSILKALPSGERSSQAVAPLPATAGGPGVDVASVEVERLSPSLNFLFEDRG
jgi:hypothetical protein